MLINVPDTINTRVQFVNYTGKYPNLCSGVLTLLIEGKKVKFGHELEDYDFKTKKYNDGNYDKFWHSGGTVSLCDGCTTREWVVDCKELPDEYKPYAREIDYVLNENIEWGCCGGCL